MKRGVLGLALAAVALVLAACGSWSNAQGTGLKTPSYYVVESITIDGHTITDPNQLVLDGDGGHFENWYYLSLALLDDTSGMLCTDGRIVNFTYDLDDNEITLHASTNQGLDFGFDGQTLNVGDGTLSMKDGVGTTVLARTEEQLPDWERVAKESQSLAKDANGAQVILRRN